MKYFLNRCHWQSLYDDEDSSFIYQATLPGAVDPNEFVSTLTPEDSDGKYMVNYIAEYLNGSTIEWEIGAAYIVFDEAIPIGWKIRRSELYASSSGNSTVSFTANPTIRMGVLLADEAQNVNNLTEGIYVGNPTNNGVEIWSTDTVVGPDLSTYGAYLALSPSNTTSGGDIELYGGGVEYVEGSETTPQGGEIRIRAGNSPFVGGRINIEAGAGLNVLGTETSWTSQGGDVLINGGDSHGVGNYGGELYLSPGRGSNGASGGNLTLVAGYADDDGTPGNLLLVNLPTSDPMVENALWNDGGTLKISAG